MKLFSDVNNELLLCYFASAECLYGLADILMEFYILFLSLPYNLVIVFTHFCTSLQLQVFDSHHNLIKKMKRR